MRGLPAGPRCISRKMLRSHHHGCEVELHAAKLFGNHDGRKPQRGSLSHDVPRDTGFVMLDGIEVWFDLVRPELINGSTKREMPLAEVFYREDLGWSAALDQKGSTADSGKQYGYRSHDVLHPCSGLFLPIELSEGAAAFGKAAEQRRRQPKVTAMALAKFLDTGQHRLQSYPCCLANWTSAPCREPVAVEVHDVDIRRAQGDSFAQQMRAFIYQCEGASVDNFLAAASAPLDPRLPCTLLDECVSFG